MLEALFHKATLAWDPLGQIRERVSNDTLTVGAVLAACIGVVIASNLANIASRDVYFETLFAAAGTSYEAHPVFKSKVSQEFISALALLPIAAVGLLPRAMFNPAGKNATIAAILVVMSSCVFFTSVAGIAGHLLASLATLADPKRGLLIFTVSGAISAAIMLFYITVIWSKATKLLHISRGSSAVTVVVFILAWVGIVLFFAILMAGAQTADPTVDEFMIP